MSSKQLKDLLPAANCHPIKGYFSYLQTFFFMCFLFFPPFRKRNANLYTIIPVVVNVSN